MSDDIKDLAEDFAEYADWQYEQSYEAADAFINDGLFESLVEFDLANEDEDYVPGTAIYGMTHYCLDALIHACGFTKDDILHLVNEVFESQEETSVGQTIH